MNNLHHSDKSARSPENNSVMYRISACGCNSLNENYIQLDNILFEKQFYEYIDIQPYLPNDVVKRYRFIKDLQLMFPIGVYRYHQGNYLGTINYVWRIPKIEVFDDEHETLKASDSNIIFDLRTNNGFNGTKFNVFWNELEAYFNEQNLLSVDERRHETVLYMLLAISVCDLREIIIERLMQSQLLQKNSDDAHYCAALFRYLREFCIQYHQWTCLISADDKHKIPIGEDVAVSTGVRNRRSMVAQDNILAAADHDFTKLSLTPSVTFFISIPNDISGSFYDGQVFVSYKDTIFEPSSAIRHLAEFLNALNIQFEHQIFPPILCLYTDGGPDHRFRTAPNHSWTNPAERVMSTLNLGLQGVALKRDQMSSESETLFDMVNTLDDIRKKAQKYSDLEFELKESIAGVQNLLKSRTERLLFKSKKLKCHTPATEEEIAELFEFIFNIDSTLKIKETTQAQIHSHPALVEFIKTHCRIKKCNNPACLYCKPIRLPLNEFHNLSFLLDPIPSQDNTDHYATFQNVYGTETTEEYRPTYMQSQVNAEPIPKSILVVAKIRGYINCKDCGKRCCVYSDKSLTCKEQEDYQQAMDLYSYSCGAPIFPDDHYLKEVVFVRTRISCDSPIEILYYSSRRSGNYIICYYCGEREDLVTSSQSLKERFKQIYPLCEGCQENGKEFYTKGEIKTNGCASKRRKHG
ncbi:hypothetical protein RirG_223030 [Rhizophagus irregularis DAOM 197198w]|uniref:Uncharacterized protein n=1 Tax=Rhizophagus irregularis (strain DAOM 197198w) TaxID=1432141 RepID=A0A015K8E0_RHIIW|nr:hypothetical protein RirG_223030 [Rhizophagus irregularis DAOM 197198w]